MTEVLPQQRLFLELLIMSGDIGVPDTDNGTLLFRTLKECEEHGWITLKHFGYGYDKAAITEQGRVAVKDRRSEIRPR